MLNFMRFNSAKLSNKGQRRDKGGGGEKKGWRKEQKMGEDRGKESRMAMHENVKETRVKNWNVKETRVKI